MDEVVRTDDCAVRALTALDIDPSDHHKLAKVLDHNHEGQIKIFDVLNGLQRLRGQNRRSDVISCELVIEGVQEKIEEILQSTRQENCMITTTGLQNPLFTTV